ncbi:uncharacterized protein BDZ99DRAFT_537888 [Mytilinidion resinicola]|uniref:Uncharacterized protein n=1 Tax=Mytilinidion resinicola TaxID=574789 RepID=A0A6A6YDP2_9PEZI|nr:uncharacterized protein BDZ99DRAFT_537888 [Mytilinidion resinicola]KAF2806936.1 hypothetical protein BDZ99DRAFT_537888 [Mytilinidion resinicola]
MPPGLTRKRLFLGLASILLYITLIPNPLHSYIRRRQTYNPFRAYSSNPSSTTPLTLPGSLILAPFSPSINCIEWLQQMNDTIIYPFGVFPHDYGALELASCIAREEAMEINARIRHIQVAFPLSGSPQAYLTPLQDIMVLLPNLETVSWSSWNWPIIDDLTSWAKEHKSNVKTQTIDRTVRPFEGCQSTLQVGASYDGNDELFVVDQAYDILTTFPKVESLSLSFAQGGCLVELSNPWSSNFRWYDTFPSLDYLELSDYRWDDICGNKKESVASWKKHIDWTKLRTLDIDLPPNSFLDVFKGEELLQSLESLTLRPKWSFRGNETTFCKFDDEATQLRANYTAFITSLRPLRELSISGMGKHLDIVPILERHGTTLRKLSIHEFERDCPNRTRPYLVHQLAQIREYAPFLHTLELDFIRGPTGWPGDSIEELADFEQLRELTMHFDLEDPEWQMRNLECVARSEHPEKCPLVAALAEPRLNLPDARKMFRYLIQLGTMTNENESWEKIWTFTTGECGRRQGGGTRFREDYVPMPRQGRVFV